VLPPTSDFTLLGSVPGTTQAQISYKWAPLSFNIEELFAKEIKTGTTPSCHPKIVQLKKGLQNSLRQRKTKTAAWL
jgi:hypothetical protein